MRLAIAGGAGICGITSMPGLYPVLNTPDPCGPINPCGGGICAVKLGKARCQCPVGFARVKNIDGTQTCTAVRVCSLTASNPCHVGTCLDDGKGGYNCICPPGFVSGPNPDGSISCVPGPTPDNFEAVPGLTCDIVRSTFGLSLANFTALNPKLDCTMLQKGDDIYVGQGVGCATPYTVTPTDTCDSIALKFKMTKDTLLDYNDDLRCRRLQAGQQICVQQGTPDLPACQEFVTVADGDTCDSIMKGARPPLSPQDFYTLNPGLNCNAGTQMLLGQQICVRGGLSSELLGAARCVTKQFYSVVAGDTCSRIITNVYQGSARMLSQYNSGYVCTNTRLYNGMKLCKPPT
eukprot:TRINITY_DN24637_c1_g2_i2.p1 TRINITY_DN24637_c1_g2~~TRINITY_DN24637_c1_g2_i2.p1  ORF type:complete len:361 (-),score=-8.22 TRINITY_DN24637_c1_g2_i2:106-1149(-)